MDEQRVEQHEIKELEYRKSDWIIFIVGAAATIFLLQYDPRFFWLALPFALTFLVKALKMM